MRSQQNSQISNPDKIFWPEEKYTKQDLANCYRDIFPLLRPYVNDRILTLERCPDGMAGQCFYQKQKPQGMPASTPTKRIQNATGKRKATDYVLGGLLSTQLALVNLGCIPVHALLVREALDELGLLSYPKTSGSRGMHIFIPIRLGPTADEVLRFAEDFSSRLARNYPKQITFEHSIAQRGDRVYLDPFRNGLMQTVVSPYSVRRKPHAPVSTPLSWSEVTPKLDPSNFNLGNFRSRLKKDPWSDFFANRQSLSKAIANLKKI